MKFRAAALLLACLAAGRADARQVGPALALRDVPLADALQIFVERTGASVAYDPGRVAGKRVFCVTALAAPEAWLRCLLEGTGLEAFRRASGTFVIGPVLELPPSWGFISGRVLDAESGAPLEGASVLLADAGRGTAVDRSGRFALDRLLPGRYAVTVTHLGYAPWTDSIAVAAGSGTRFDAVLAGAPVAIRPVIVEADQSGGDPWLAALDAAAQRLPRAVERARAVETRLADRAGVTISDVTADVRIQGGETSDVSLRLDGVPLFVPRSIAGFVGTLGPSALDRITVYGAGRDAPAGSGTGGILDMRHALAGSPGFEAQVDPFAASGSVRLAGADDRLRAFASLRHGLGESMLPASLDRMLRAWSGPDPFLLVAPLRRYDLATPAAIGYATGLLVEASPRLTFDDVHVAARFRPRPSESWDASAHVGSRSVSGSRTGPERLSDGASGAPLFAEVDAHDWATRMAQVRHERVLGSRTFVTAQAWTTAYRLDHDYRLADRIGSIFAEAVLSVDASSLGASRDGNRVNAWGLTAEVSHARGRHSVVSGLEVGRTTSRFDLRLASVASGRLTERLVADPSAPVGTVLFDTTTVFEARHAQVSSRAGETLATAFASDRLVLGRFTVEPGIRLTWRAERTTVYAEPRLRAAFSAPSTPVGSVAATLATGIYRQYLNQFDVSSLNAGAFFPSTRIWMPLDASQRAPRSAHVSGSVTAAPTRTFSLVADAYVKDLRHGLAFNYAVDPSLLVEGARLSQRDLLVDSRGVDRGLGISAGFEARRWTARLRYERSVSWRRAEGLFGGRRVTTAGHAPHHLTAALDAAPSGAIDLGLRASAEYGRAWAFRPVYYDYFGHDEATSTHAGFDFSDPGAHRLPALVTVDATAAWTLALGRARMQLRVEVRNLAGRANELDRRLLWNGEALVPAARLYPGRVTAAAVRVIW